MAQPPLPPPPFPPPPPHEHKDFGPEVSSHDDDDQKCTEATFASLLPINAVLEHVDTVPAGSSYGEGAANLGYPTNPTNLPALCAVTVRVASSMTSAYRFGLFLPPPPAPTPTTSPHHHGDEEEEEEAHGFETRAAKGTTAWNGRFLTLGNGGFAGGINWLEMGAGARYGFASLSTDTGHSSSGTELRWALGNPEGRADWGWRAVHGSVALGKRLVEAYYSSSTSFPSSPPPPPPTDTDPDDDTTETPSNVSASSSGNSIIKASYYSGCSTGGRQGLKELQISPSSFDGVLVGGPAWYTSHVNNWGNKVAQWNWPASKPGHIPWTVFKPLARRVAAQCDGVDGVSDGIVSAPEACVVDYGALACSAGRKATTEPTGDDDDGEDVCLSADQIDTLRKLYGDWTSSTTGSLLFPGLLPGSEAQMPVVLNYSEGSPYMVGYARYFLLDDPLFSVVRDFNDSVAQLAAQFDPGQATADVYDLTAFRDLGGKVVMYHGLADALVPTKGSELYYNRTVEAMGNNLTSTQSFFRYIPVPGMQHCSGTAVDAPWSFGGSYQGSVFSPDTYSVPGFVGDPNYDILMALVDWVENDRPVESVIATTWRNATDASSGILRQRPLCPWPRSAVWDGTGDVDLAGSWSCGGGDGDGGGGGGDNNGTVPPPESAAIQMWTNPPSSVLGMVWLLFMAWAAL